MTLYIFQVHNELSERIVYSAHLNRVRPLLFRALFQLPRPIFDSKKKKWNLEPIPGVVRPSTASFQEHRLPRFTADLWRPYCSDYSI